MDRGDRRIWSFTFHISDHQLLERRDPILEASLGRRASEATDLRGDLPSSRTASEGFQLPPDFPNVTVLHSDRPTPGSILLSPYIGSNGYLMILDNDGNPEFFRRMDTRAVDFKKQPNGLLTYFLLSTREYYAMDNTYAVVDSFAAGNGYVADSHELRLLPNDHALLMSYDPQMVDMSQIVENGDPEAVVIGLVLQELDSAHNVVFQWRSWDHFQITDAGDSVDLTAGRVDYVHGNAIDVDFDGNLLVSSRHLDEITKICRQTGDVIWRLGGKANEFALVNDNVWFSRQHGIRRLANGHLILFDNGNLNDPAESRAVEYEIDEDRRVLTKIWEYRNTPSTYSALMGFAQRLPNANTLIAWGGATPTLTEVRPDGSKALELTLDESIWTYRAFRHQWNGVASTPYVWANKNRQELTLSFAKFGDQDVIEFRVYQGTAPNPTTRVTSTFRPFVTIHGFTAGTPLYFRVRAVSPDGSESPFSNEIVVVPDFSDDLGTMPASIALLQNFPNPFQAATRIPFDLPADTHIDLRIYNVLGEQVRDLTGEQVGGERAIRWDGRNESGHPVPAGVYFYRLRAADFSKSKRMVLLR
jgi:hypothetical protein